MWIEKICTRTSEMPEFGAYDQEVIKKNKRFKKIHLFSCFISFLNPGSYLLNPKIPNTCAPPPRKRHNYLEKYPDCGT